MFIFFLLVACVAQESYSAERASLQSLRAHRKVPYNKPSCKKSYVSNVDSLATDMDQLSLSQENAFNLDSVAIKISELHVANQNVSNPQKNRLQLIQSYEEIEILIPVILKNFKKMAVPLNWNNFQTNYIVEKVCKSNNIDSLYLFLKWDEYCKRQG